MDHQSPLGRRQQAPSQMRSVPPSEAIALQLAARHSHAFCRGTVKNYVEECSWQLPTQARVGRHIPVPFERLADQQLGALARGRGLVPKAVPEAPFVCTQNAGRLQIAAALMRHRTGGAIRVLAAGSAPVVEIAPVMLQLLTKQRPDTGYPTRRRGPTAWSRSRPWSH
ncbi:hypothetical protein OG936_37390 [Streptomyces sp. NBC_00846]|uniref:hypothetical protein n=1 Tax=Streptomyces sp. NBC_00846 TaxID=2975849 RepID=UPI0038696722|nr:hypothetical protein OG936_37390 [Streptomyces sp. NBC_00846]